MGEGPHEQIPDVPHGTVLLHSSRGSTLPSLFSAGVGTSFEAPPAPETPSLPIGVETNSKARVSSFRLLRLES